MTSKNEILFSDSDKRKQFTFKTLEPIKYIQMLPLMFTVNAFQTRADSFELAHISKYVNGCNDVINNRY